MEKSTQNDSIKGELEETLCVALEGAPKISFKEAQKNGKKCEEKDAFGVAVDGPLDGAIKGAPLNLTFCFLYLIERRINRIVDIFKLGSIGKSRMRKRRRKNGELWPKA